MIVQEKKNTEKQNTHKEENMVKKFKKNYIDKIQ